MLDTRLRYLKPLKNLRSILGKDLTPYYYDPIIKQLTLLTQLDIKYFLSGSFFASVQQVVGLFCGSIFTYLMGHYISQQVYGEYNLILSTVSLITFFSLPGLDIAVTQAVSQKKDGSLNASVNAKGRISILGSLSLGGFAYYYYTKGNFTIALALLVVSLVYPFLYSFNTATAYLTARQRFYNLALIASLSSIFFVVSMTISIFTSASTIGLIIGYLTALIIPSFISYLYTKRLIRNNAVPPDLLNYGYFLTIISALPWITGNFGSILLGNNNGMHTLALFSVAGNFLVVAQKISIVFYKPITAKLAIQNSKQHLHTLKYHAWKLLLIGCIIYGLLWLIIPFLVRFFYSADYVQAIYYSRLLCLALIPLPLSWVMNDIITFQKLRVPLFITSIVPPIARLVVYIISIPFLGIIGLIYSILIERILSLLLPLGVLLLHTKTHIRRSFK